MRLILVGFTIAAAFVIGNQAINIVTEMQDSKLAKYCQIDPSFSPKCSQWKFSYLSSSVLYYGTMMMRDPLPLNNSIMSQISSNQNQQPKKSSTNTSKQDWQDFWENEDPQSKPSSLNEYVKRSPNQTLNEWQNLILSLSINKYSIKIKQGLLLSLILPISLSVSKNGIKHHKRN